MDRAAHNVVEHGSASKGAHVSFTFDFKSEPAAQPKRVISSFYVSFPYLSVS